ncbi:MAG TPA: hypothetical protein DHV70_00985 [Firmicutes bacterium]|nr:hypothetical protein [Bacillota bacterium]
MDNQKIMIKLINEIDNIISDIYDLDDLLFPESVGTLNEFSRKIDELLINGSNDELLQMINKLEYKDIFLVHNGEFKNNKNRKIIEEYILNNYKLYLDYDLIKENIKDNYKLVKYVKDKSKLCELVNLNEKVLLLLDGKYLTEELVENEINKSDFISEVFLGIYGSDNDLFKYSSYYKNIKNIDEILFEQLKDILKSDPYKFIKSSDIIKQNKKIIELVTSIDSRLKAYAK